MAQASRDVKSDPGHRSDGPVGLRDRCLGFIDAHPRVGWYVAIISTLNVILNLVQIFH